jgi:anti-anti-sigma factor
MFVTGRSNSRFALSGTWEVAMDAVSAVEVLVDDGVTRVTVLGEFDRDLATGFASAAGRGDGAVVVDLAQVTFLDSGGISVLINAVRALAVEGRTLRVMNAAPLAGQVLEISGLEDLLGIETDPAH